MDAHVLSTSSLTGTDVVNPKGESLGDIKDVMVDLDSGSIAYAVLSFGGFLGFGDKYFAIPWEAFTMDETNNKIILDVKKETLDDAPGFDKDHWPEQPDQDFLSRIHSHYGYKPYWETNPSFGQDRHLDENRVIGSDRTSVDKGGFEKDIFEEDFPNTGEKDSTRRKSDDTDFIV